MNRAAFLAVLVLVGCSPASAPRGGAAQAVAAPTIVSLNPCSDAILAEVADPAQLLAISHYSHDERASSMDVDLARRFRATGGTVEEVLALDPDVVVASSFLAPATRAAFTDLGIRVETLDSPTSVAAALAQVRQLAALAGEPARGEALVARIEHGLSANAPEPGSAPVPTVLWQPGGLVPGEGELISELMARAGLASHSAARGMAQADYLSLERVLADPPRLLLVAGNARGQGHPALAQAKGMQVERFDASLIYCGGPTLIRAMERLGEVRNASDPFVSSEVETQ